MPTNSPNVDIPGSPSEARRPRRRAAASRATVFAVVVLGAGFAGVIGWLVGRTRSTAPITAPLERAPAPDASRPKSPSPAPRFDPLDITQVERLQRSFDPTAGEKTTIRFALSRQADLSVNIHGPNRELIAAVLDKKAASAGLHTVDWDGRDWAGRVAPDEAYFVRIQAIDGTESALWDPYVVSGGERVTAGVLTTPAPGRFQYQLPDACRVLVRSAVEKGPLVRTIVNWEPRTAGLCVEDWDGMDSDGLRRVADIEGIRIGVMAFTLPDKSIITTGNTAIDYRSYYRDFGKERPHTDIAPRVKTSEALISPHWEIPPHLNGDPRLTMAFVDVAGGATAKTPAAENAETHATESPTGDSGKNVTRLTKNGRPVLVRVEVPDASEMEFLNKQRFELIVYVDDHRVIEVEQGHVPFTYPWDISGLDPGLHTLTVNVSTFRNHVGTATRVVNVAP